MTKKLMKLLISLCLCTTLALCAVGFTACGGSSNPKFTLCNGDTAYAISGYEGNAKTFKIPAKYSGLPVVAISDKAFYGNIYLTEIVIPDSITSIGNWAFYDCWCLKKLTIPASVKTIGEHISNSLYFKSIDYKGTKAQWENISKNSLWRSNSMISQIVCTDGTIAL